MNETNNRFRLLSLSFILVVLVLAIVVRLFSLGIWQRPFLLEQSQARVLRKMVIPAYRGMISDRHGEPLAVSTPVDSVWVNPKLFVASAKDLSGLADILGMKSQDILKRVQRSKKKSFLYLKRRIPPEQGHLVRALSLPGVYLQREYRRYYPSGEVSAHVVGFTNVDDKGQEGLELAYNEWLAGVAGTKEVVKDRKGHVVETIALLKKPKKGHALVLSIDERIQYAAFRSLAETVKKFKAQSGSVVVLDTQTGEILAMVNAPSYNPNNRPSRHDGRYRNRALTDIFEPGSTIKPFNLALALESGKYTKDTKIDTNPGWMVIDGHEIKDDGMNYGVITLTELLQKSSNIGAAKVMLSLSPDDYWQLLHRVGFGQTPGTHFPGEASGVLPVQTHWSPVEIASVAFGYGMSISTVQLARAYSVLANGGMIRDLSLIKLKSPKPARRVMPKAVANALLEMMRSVVGRGGTGRRAAVPGFKVAGKTGTAYIASGGRYNKKDPHYMASFVGIAPASRPRLVVAVVIRDPQGEHFGGLVAAPLFAKVMGSALRIMNIAPDDLGDKPVK